MVGNGQWLLPFLTDFFNLKAYMCHYWKEHNTTGADDRTINLQSVLVTRALSLKNWSFRLHEHDKMHSSRIVITHFNQARKNYQMNKSTTKQTLNKNKTRQKAKQTTSDTQITQCGNISCISDSHLAPKFFKVVACLFVIRKKSVAISEDKQNLFLCCQRSK